MPRLIGNKIVLREYRKEDLEYINEFTRDLEIVKYLSDIFLRNHTMENTKAFLDSVLNERSNDSLKFVIADKDTLEYIGQVDIININWISRVGTLGIVIGRSGLLGQGLGTEAIKLLLDYAFTRANLRKVELDVVEFNERGIRCYEKCGFIREGLIRENHYIQGRYFNTVKMGILKREFIN